jgi:hydrogenase expression/formation protein HypE
MNRSGSFHEQVMLAHGGGGTLMGELIREHVLGPLENELLAPLDDGAVVPWDGDGVVLTTDSYVVTPLEFPGGDIGRLAVAGTVNDVAVMGATPVALSLGLILEEGLPLDQLDRIIASIAATAREADVRIVTGDTKVIERRGDGATPAGMFINTAGIGRRRDGVTLGLAQVRPGDAILVTGHLAEHGLAIMSVREGLEFDTVLKSDAAPLAGLLAEAFAVAGAVRFCRDATRGGVAGVLADIAEHTRQSVEIHEERIPLTPTARHAAEMLGLDPLTVANEGKCVLVVAAEHAEAVCAACRRHPLGRNAAVIGQVVARQPALVELVTRVGGRRVVQRPYGEELPRIC